MRPARRYPEWRQNPVQLTGDMRIGVLALQGDFREHASMVERVGAEPIEVRLAAQLPGLDGVIVPGGESTTIARLLDAYELLAPLRTAGRGGMAIWGTCAGMILLARQVTDLDRPGLELMDLGVRRNAFGRQVDSFETDLSIPVLGSSPYHAVFIRAPVIERVGDDVEVLARLPDGRPVAAREGSLLVTSFHPELTDDPRFHRYFLELASSRASLVEELAGG